MKRLLTFILIALIGITAVNAYANGLERKPKQTQQTAPAKPKKEKRQSGKKNKRNKQKTAQQTIQSDSSQTDQKNGIQLTQSETVSEGVQYGSHYFVDLGLPSGTKWATMNVGASSPSDYGYYFAWGETSTKSSYEWSNLRYWVMGNRLNNVTFSKYVTNSKWGNVDGKSELDPSDDAAYVNWGQGWCMPSRAQLDELRESCMWIWTSMGGHDGHKVVGKNGNSIFLPAAGFRDGSSSRDAGSYGNYWSRTLDVSEGGGAYALGFYSGGAYAGGGNRSYGYPIRAVLCLE